LAFKSEFSIKRPQLSGTFSTILFNEGEKNQHRIRAYPKNKTPSEFGSYDHQIPIITIYDMASAADLPYDIFNRGIFGIGSNTLRISWAL
jgi:hypothetical protein